MCLYPKLMWNKKYTKTKKNGGIVPVLTDQRIKYIAVGCQRCMECRRQKSNGWKIRLLEEVKSDNKAVFVTLTFSDESILHITEQLSESEATGYQLDNAIASYAVRHFLERWRKKFKTSVKHWLTTELGHNGTENIHLHGLIWTNESIATIKERWGYGYIYPRNEEIRKKQSISAKTVNYISKYITKIDLQNREYIGKVFTSKGIGKSYINSPNFTKHNKFKEESTSSAYIFSNGKKGSLPIYYRNVVYTESEREKLWIHKLNEGVRYINGVKIKEEDIEGVNKVLAAARIENKRKGFGSDEKNYSEEAYNRRRRNMLIETRKAKALKKRK